MSKKEKITDHQSSLMDGEAVTSHEPGAGKTSPADSALVKQQNASLAVSDADLLEMFGGENTPPPLELAWPEIKLTKTSDFKMPDESKVSELTGHIIFIKRSRAWWEADYDGNNNPPDCASTDCSKPDSGDKQQSDKCGRNLCPKATWYKTEDPKTGKITSHMDCSESANVFFLPDGSSIPHFMRVRSTSIGINSPFAKFLANCVDEKKAFALFNKYPTVNVRLTLDETKINNFDTSILQVAKIETITNDDPLLRVLGNLFKEVEKEFIVVHRSEAVVTDDPKGSPSEYTDETPI